MFELSSKQKIQAFWQSGAHVSPKIEKLTEISLFGLKWNFI